MSRSIFLFIPFRTYSDTQGTIDGKQWLDLGCFEYEIPKGKFKDGDNVEVIIRKIRKGE